MRKREVYSLVYLPLTGVSKQTPITSILIDQQTEYS